MTCQFASNTRGRLVILMKNKTHLLNIYKLYNNNTIIIPPEVQTPKSQYFREQQLKLGDPND
jgi:hypothetical protein